MYVKSDWSCPDIKQLRYRIMKSQNSPGWKGLWKINSSKLLWEREHRWGFLAPSPISSWKLPLIETLYTSWFHLNAGMKKLLYLFFSVKLVIDMKEMSKFRSLSIWFQPIVYLVVLWTKLPASDFFLLLLMLPLC